MFFKSAVIIALTFLFTTFAFGLLSKDTQSKQEAAKAVEQNLTGNEAKSRQTAKEVDDAATPIVDLISSYSADVNTDRWFKNNRYDNKAIVKSEVHPEAAAVVWESRGDITDIPTDKSDLIVEGTVTDSAAFLSNDKGAVFSEITVRVSDVLKGTADLNVRNGDSIVTERLGGRIKHPNGQIVRYGFVGQGSPAKGKNYLFFLSRAEQGNYNILTAYELLGNKVQALDGARVNLGRGSWAFDKHNDEDYQAFRKATEQAVKNPPSGNQKRRFNP